MRAPTEVTDSQLTRDQIDLTNCDREPIHIPGSIQPHGVLVAVDEKDWTIRQASVNTQAAFGLEPSAILGAPLTAVLGEEQTARLREQMEGEVLDDSPHYLTPMTLRRGGPPWESIVHRRNGLLMLEFEGWDASLPVQLQELHAAVRATMNQLQKAESLAAFCQMAAERVRQFSGFDRVMVYRFLDDGSGHVFAEARREDLESFLGLHYPASDIPAQARELFRKSWLRLLPDTGCQPVPMVAVETGAAPLDMSFTAVRSISPIHMEYLQNMGVGGSMSISILKDGELWGLFACHHYSRKYLPHSARMACEFLASLLSLQVGRKEEADAGTYVNRMGAWNERLRDEMAARGDFIEPLVKGPDSLPGAMEADGAALLLDGTWRVMGIAPAPAVLEQLKARLDSQPEEVVFTSRQLGTDMPDAGFDPAVSAGVLAVRLTKFKPEYLFWFRREYRQKIHWAGDPAKPMGVGPMGDRLTPRKSFDLWTQEAIGKSKPWQRWEIEAARDLRRTVIETIVRRVQKLTLLNAELERSNFELDSFAYVASHDLKEPLRGIRNLTHFVLEDHGGTLPQEGSEMLNSIQRLSQRMESLLDSLLRYSQVGRLELKMETVEMQTELSHAAMILGPRLKHGKVELRVPRPLPRVKGDVSQTGEILQNLVSNALKYQDPAKSEHWIEVTWGEEAPDPERDASPPPPLWKFAVRDNGIGIPQKRLEDIFKIFRRLHAQEEFGGGAGAGLTIARKIAQRHGGRLWVESTEGEGSTFFFTLPQAPP